MTTRVPPAVLLDALTPPAPLPTWTASGRAYAPLEERLLQVVELIHAHDQRQRDREAER